MNGQRVAWIFVGPAVIVVGLFFALPVVAAFALSLTDFDLYALASLKNLRFVGLGNYLDVLRTPLFWQSLFNTAYFVVAGVPVTLAAALGSAMLLNSPMARLKGLHRTVLFAPVVTTVVAVAVIWRYLFQTRYGLIDYALAHIGVAPIDWLGDPHWSMPAIILFAAWKNFGYSMIILLAGLQGIPPELYEAARIDGASAWRQFLHITLPSLRPLLVLVAIITVAGYFQLFAEPYVMTMGEPLHSTYSALYLMYDQGFKWWNLGRASAIAFLLFLVIGAATVALLHFARKDEA